MLLDRLKATGRVCTLFLGVFALSTAAQAGPEDGRIVNGSGSISQSGTHTDIRQNSDFLATHWGSFNIAAHESVQAHQPRSTSRLLIRVDGGAATNIAGSYTSNGITILENRNGVQFSRGAIVNVGGLLATSSRISGVGGNHWQLDGVGGAVVNHGQIVAGAGGAILAAVKVQNTGDIISKGGDVSLGAGSAFTVDFAGSMVGFEVSQAASGASITNSGKIEAQGGVVALSAQEAQAVRTNVVSVGGVVKATRIERRGGVVYLSGGTQGIAEVSGAVSASDKIQTTGEYVVVKEGAVLRAPEILVGGDFQGKGNVPTAKRTLVERGALLDAGAEGRVIVWSDDVTWFNGNITAPGGFAEVSGKQTLASVNLAGIAVGELLLDPEDIIIAASGTGDAVTDSIAANAEGMTLTLNVDSINDFTGALSLAASNTIMVNVAINKPTGNLTLIAGGSLTVNGVNIDNGANTLTLTAGSGGTGSIAPCSFCVLTASTVNITQTFTFPVGALLTFVADTLNLTTMSVSAQPVRDWMTLGNRALSLTSDGAITINSDVDTGTGALNLTSTGGIVLGGDITLSAASVGLTGAINASAAGHSFTVTASGDITLNSNINLGQGALDLRAGVDGESTTNDGNLSNGGGSREIRAGSLHLQQDDYFADNLFTNSSNITGAVDIRLGKAGPEAATFTFFGGGSWISLLGQGDLTISGIEGVVINSILTFAQFDRSQGEVTLVAKVLILGTVTQARAFTLRADTIQFAELTATHGGFTFTRADGTGKPTLSSGTASLELGQNGAFGAEAPFIFNEELARIRLRTGAPQELQPWMVGADRGLALFSGGALTINADISATDGSSSDDILLSGTSIVLTRDINLTGTNVTLTGVIDASEAGHSLTIMTSAVLTLNSNINLGAGNLTLQGMDLFSSGGDLTSEGIELGSNVRLEGGAISFSGMIDESASGNGGNENLTILASGRLTFNNTINLGTGILRINASERINVANADTSFNASLIDINFADPAVETAVAGFTIGSTNTSTRASFTPTPTYTFMDELPAAEGCNANTCELGDGTTGLNVAPTLTAMTSITLNAGSHPLNFEGTGDITLTAPIITIAAGSINIGARNLIITAAGGTLTLTTSSITTTGNITLSSASIVLGSGITLRGRAISFSGVIDESSSGNDALTVTASGVLTLNSNINTGIGNLNFSGSSIALGADIELTGGAITLTGAISESSSGNRPLTITASGVLRFNSNINTGTGALSLRGSSISLDGGARTLIGGAITLTGAINRGNRAFTVMASDVLTLSNNINTGTSALTLSGMGGIVLGGNIRLSGGAINLTGAINELVNTRNLTIIASGILTLNNSIELNAGTPGALRLTATFIDIPTAAGTIDLGGTPFTIEFTGPDATTAEIGFVGDGEDRVNLSDALVYTFLPSNCTADECVLESNTPDTPFRVSPTLNADTSITIDAGANPLTFGGTGSITIEAPIVSITADTIDIGGRTLTITANGGTLTLSISNSITATGNINLSGTNIMLSKALTISALTLILTGTLDTNVPVFFATSLLTRLNGTINTGTAALTLTSSGGILLDGDAVALSGGAVTITGVINETSSGNDPLTITASGVLTLNTRINTGTGNLTLSGASITLGSAVDTLRGGVVSITGAISRSIGNLNITASGALTLNDNINTGTGNLTLEGTGGITLGGGVELTAGNISLTGAIASANNDLTISATTLLTLDSNIDRGTGNLTLNLGTAQAVLAGVRMLSGNVVTIGGTLGLETDGDLTISAGGNLMVNTNISLGSGATTTLQLLAGRGTGQTGDISFTSLTTEIRASRFLLTQNGAVFGNTRPAVFQNANGDGLTPEATKLVARITFDGTGTQNEVAWATRFSSTVSLGMGSTFEVAAADLTVGVLEALESITLDAGTGILTFAGTDDITLRAPTITITAGTINLGADRNLTITASTGALTLITVGMITGTGTAALSLSGATIVGLSTALTVNVPSISIAQNAVFGGSAPITFGAAVTSLTLSTDAAQVVHDWMIAADRALTLTSAGALRVEAAINLGAGNLSLTSTGGIIRIFENISTTGNITLSGGTGINLNGRAAKTLRGAAIMLTGVVVSNRNLTITASGTLTLNSDIMAGTRSLELTGSGGITLGGALTIDGRFTTLTGAATGSTDLTITASRSLRINNNINTGAGNLTLTGGSGGLNLNGGIAVGEVKTLSGADITLTGDARSNRDLTFTASGTLRINNDITLTSARNITLTSTGGAVRILADIITTDGNITLSGSTGGINFNGGGAKTLSGADITLTGDAQSNRDLTFTASGTLGINSNITLTGARALSLSGATEINFNGGGAKTLSSADITLTGVVVSNRDLTFTASGTLRIESNITLTEAGALSFDEHGGISQNFRRHLIRRQYHFERRKWDQSQRWDSKDIKRRNLSCSPALRRAIAI